VARRTVARVWRYAMRRYIARRLLAMLPLLAGITLITFGVMHLTPGTPASLLTDANPKISIEAKQRLAGLYGFDRPWYIQYASWVKRFVKLDFGVSFKDNRKVITKIAERLPATLLLNIVSLGAIFLLALPIGIISAIKQNTLLDRGLTVFVFIGFSMPAFWLALILMVVFGVWLGWLPISGLTSLQFDELSLAGKIGDIARHLVLPVAVSSFGGLAGLSRYMRSSMLEVVRQDYIKAARARGLSETAVLCRHALKNALIPVVTILGLSLPELIGGSFIFETIFAYPGMGRLGYEAILARDYATVMGVGTVVALLTLLGNLIADIAYAFVDPRIRYT